MTLQAHIRHAQRTGALGAYQVEPPPSFTDTLTAWSPTGGEPWPPLCSTIPQLSVDANEGLTCQDQNSPRASPPPGWHSCGNDIEVVACSAASHGAGVTDRDR